MLLWLITEFALSATFTVQDHALFANIKDTDDPTSQAESRLLNQLNVSAEGEKIRSMVGVSNVLAPNQNRPAVLEKKLVSYETEKFNLKVGDSLHQLGRGIALALYQDDTFGVHNTLEGISTGYRLPAIDLSAFGGRINALELPITVLPVDDPLRDRTVYLAGFSLDTHIVGDWGAHYFHSAAEPRVGTDRKRWNTFGATFETSFDDSIDLYVESNAVMSSRDSSNRTIQNPMAFGSYGSLSFSPAAWKWKLEVKDYRKYDFEFRRPPTLEDDIVVTQNNEDVSAARLSLDRRHDPGRYSATLLSGYDRVVQTQLYHATLGGRLHFDRRELELKGGYRLLPDVGDLRHLSGKVKLPTLKRQSIELTLRKQLEKKNLRTLASVEDRNIAEVTYNVSERWNTGVGVEHVPTNLDEQGREFLNASLSFKQGTTTARLFVGQTSGGTRCSGGVCRRVPPFSGAMLEGYFTF